MNRKRMVVRDFFKIILVFLFLIIIVSCGGRPIKAYRGEDLSSEQTISLMTKPNRSHAFMQGYTDFLTHVKQIDDIKLKYYGNGSDTYKILPGKHTVYFFMSEQRYRYGQFIPHRTYYAKTKVLSAQFTAEAGRVYLITGYSLREKDKLAPWVYLGVISEGKKMWYPLPNVKISASD